MKQTRKCAFAISISLTVILFFSTAFTQTINWEKKFSSANDGSVVQSLTDGGYIAAGGYGPSAIIRTNAQGDSTWGKAIDLNAYGVQSVAGGYVLSGMLNSHPYVIKLDQSGTKVWDRYIGGKGMYDNADGIIATSDALYITGTFYNNDQTYSLFITKLSLAGDSIWQTTLGKHTTTNGRALTNTNGVGIAQTSDGFVVCGTADSEIYLVKFDQNGNKVWDHSYPGIHSTSDVDIAHSIAVTADGGFILCGVKALSNASFNTVIILLKTTSDGTQTWRQSVGNPGGVGQQVLVESDGYALTGWIGNNGHLIKTDLQGTTVWDQQLASVSAYGLDKGKDGSYTAIGAWSDGSMYLGNVKAGTPPPPDKQTYIYTYNGQAVYGFHTDAPNGWVGAGAGKISTPANSVIMVNAGIDFYTTDFTIDTTRANATGSVHFHGTGTMDIRHNPLSTAASTFGSGAFSGTISGSNITFDAPLTCPVSLAGLAVSLGSVNPGLFPTALSVSGSGIIKGQNFSSGRSSQFILFPKIVFNPTTIDLSSIGDIGVGPGDELRQISSSYDPARDRLNLNGIFVSKILFPQVPASTFIEKGNIVRIKVDQPLSRTIVGRNIPYYIDSLFAYVTPGPSAHILGRFGEIQGTTELYQVDLTDSYFSMPIKLHQSGVNFRAFKTGNQYQIIGKVDFDASWTTAHSKVNLGIASLQAGIIAGSKGEYIFGGYGTKNHGRYSYGMSFSHNADGQFSKRASMIGTIKVPDLTNVPGLGIYAQLLPKLYSPGSLIPSLLSLRDSIIILRMYQGYTRTGKLDKVSPFGIKLDISKNPSDAGFLNVTYNPPKTALTGKLSTTHYKGNSPASTKADTLQIANNISGAYIKLKGIGNPPASILTDPNGKQITQSLTDSSVLLINIDSHENWWVLDHPIPGAWLINTTGSTGDSIFAYVIEETSPFAITATQTNRTVNVSWTGTAEQNNNVDIYITEDTAGGSLQIVAKAKRSDGSATFALTDDMPECKYYIYAVSEGDGSTQDAYATTLLSNPKSILASPTGISATYSKKDTGVVVTWNNPTDPNIIGYAIRLTGNGIDSTVATPYGFQTQSTFSLLSPDGMFISMISYDSLGRTGCWSDPIALGAAGVETPRTVTAPGITLAVMPNPSSGKTSLQIALVNQTSVVISLYDEAGREVVTLPETTFGEGTFKINLGTESLSSGSYIALVRAGENLQTVRFVIQK